MTPSYDQARQLGKVYVGALNTGPGEFAALFAPEAVVSVAGRPSSPEGLRVATRPGHAGFRGARLEGERVVFTVRVIDTAAASADDRAHHILLDDDGRIVALEA